MAVRRTISAAIFLISACAPAFAEPLDNPVRPPAHSAEDVSKQVAPVMPTFGRLDWADIALHGGFRLQENVLTGEYRLIDHREREVAAGTKAECEAALAKLRNDGRFGFGRKDIVILVHGLLGSPRMFDKMRNSLADAGFEAYALRYPSTQGDLESHAARLRGLLRRLDGVERVSFVTQSMGALVVRQTLGVRWNPGASPEIGTIVLVGPPSSGSAIADMANNSSIARWIAGPAVGELTTESAKTLPRLPYPFAIIAGGRGTSVGYNPLLSGDDDGVVKIDEAFVGRAADFLRVDAVHGFLVSDTKAIEAVIRFMKTGRFRAK